MILFPVPSPSVPLTESVQDIGYPQAPSWG